MIHVRLGTAEVTLTPSIESRSDTGSTMIQYEFADLAATVAAVLRTGKGDIATFVQALGELQ